MHVSYTPPEPYRTTLQLIVLVSIYLILRPLAFIYHTALFLARPPPFPRWTYTHYITLNLGRLTYQWSLLGFGDQEDPDRWKITPSPYKADVDVGVTVVKPMKDEVPRLEGLLHTKGIVKGEEVPAFMLRPKTSKIENDLFGRASPNERVVYFIVGGGYARGHPLTIHTPWSLAKLSGGRVFCINYRKSISDSSAFPASLWDCLAGWQYLVDELGLEPKNIMLSGDSAGANASLALTRYLDELRRNGYDWGLPGSMCLHSPWSDLTSSFPSLRTNRHYDHLIDMSYQRIPAHCRHFASPLSPYFSPALTPASDPHYANLAKAGVKVYASAGTAEGMWDEINALVKNMRAKGMDVTFRPIEGGTHSEFVWLDRDSPHMGWSWPTIAQDFSSFWQTTSIY